MENDTQICTELLKKPNKQVLVSLDFKIYYLVLKITECSLDTLSDIGPIEITWDPSLPKSVTCEGGQSRSVWR